MNNVSCNCTICASEFDSGDMKEICLSNIALTNFKICQSCLDRADPTEDYKEVKDIVNTYLKFAETKSSQMDSRPVLISVDGYLL